MKRFFALFFLCVIPLAMLGNLYVSLETYNEVTHNECGFLLCVESIVAFVICTVIARCNRRRGAGHSHRVDRLRSRAGVCVLRRKQNPVLRGMRSGDGRGSRLFDALDHARLRRIALLIGKTLQRESAVWVSLLHTFSS